MKDCVTQERTIQHLHIKNACTGAAISTVYPSSRQYIDSRNAGRTQHDTTHHYRLYLISPRDAQGTAKVIKVGDELMPGVMPGDACLEPVG